MDTKAVFPPTGSSRNQAGNQKNLNQPLHSDSIHKPRTKQDFDQISEFVALGFTDAQVFEKLCNPKWRSDLVEFRGELFCVTCNSIISPNWCQECGEADWRQDGVR